MFIGYFDETKRNITVEDQKSIVDSYYILSISKEETRKDGSKNPYGNGKAAEKIREVVDGNFFK